MKQSEAEGMIKEDLRIQIHLPSPWLVEFMSLLSECIAENIPAMTV